MTDLAERLTALADETGFSGVLRVRGPETIDICRGDADRANQRPNELHTRFATASVTKGFTALATMALAEAGALTLDTTVDSMVGQDLPNVDERVTIEHLLGHRSGIGDYLDENGLDNIDAHVLGSRSVHEFDTPESFVERLAIPEQREEPGTIFRYNNSGFVILSLVLERIAGGFVTAVDTHVFAPAAMTDSGFFRADDLPGATALGYLEDGRTNVFHLPVVGAGDGGAYTTLDDLDHFWDAVVEGKIVSKAAIDAMTAPHSIVGAGVGYGRGFWVSTDGDHVWLEGMDAGVSVMTGFRRSSGLRYSVLSNTSGGVWPLAKLIHTR